MTQPPIPEGETIEEAIEKFCSIMGHNNPSARKAFKQGAEWQKSQAGGEWISVETALPQVDHFVLVWVPSIKMVCRDYYRQLELSNKLNFGYKGVTHWMPLPEPPTPQ